MSQRELWERYKKYLCVSPSVGFTLDISRMNFAADLPGRRCASPCGRPSTPWRPWRRAPSPTRTRSAVWATTGCALRRWRPRPEIGRAIRDTPRGRALVRRGDPRRAHRAADGRALHPAADRRHRRLGAGAPARGGRAGLSGGPDARLLLRQHGPGWHGPRAGAAWRQAAGDAHRRRQQVGRHQGDAQRHAGGRARLPGARPRASARTRWP